MAFDGAKPGPTGAAKLAPPPADVIVENIESEPFVPAAPPVAVAPLPPAPTVIGKVVAVIARPHAVGKLVR